MNRAIKQCVISFNLGDGYQGIQTYLTVIASISIIKKVQWWPVRSTTTT